MTSELFLGVDLAWASSGANETGVAALDRSGRVLDAGWTIGVAATVDWITKWRPADETATLFVDAPLVVDNPTGQRLCERQVGQRYGRWKVSANSTNTHSPRLAGVDLLDRLTRIGWIYNAGHDGPLSSTATVSECYPYTTLVGVAELCYAEDGERPAYKRKPRRVPTAEWATRRADTCDELIRRLDGLKAAETPLLLASHPATRKLVEQRSPRADANSSRRAANIDYKRNEDLIDAVICAWTALLWRHAGLARCQILGAAPSVTPGVHVPTIIAPAVPEQRRPDHP